jgi:hypothetical protein
VTIRELYDADLHSGFGFSVIDPHGSLIADLLGVIPGSGTDDIILLNAAADHSRIISINILESVRPAERHLVVSSVIKEFLAVELGAPGANI